jgi:hypothetical protein
MNSWPVQSRDGLDTFLNGVFLVSGAIEGRAAEVKARVHVIADRLAAWGIVYNSEIDEVGDGVANRILRQTGTLCVLLGPAEHEAERMTCWIREYPEAGLFFAMEPARSQRQDPTLGRVHVLDSDVQM